MADTGDQFRDIVEMMAHMRGPKGCAWDREQRIDSFLKHLKNESQEVLDSIEKEDYANLREELGDLLWNIVFLAQITKEDGLFDISDVMTDLKAKIVRRHPHVFGEKTISDPDEILRQWHEIKRREKEGKCGK
jgi:MazG family protein